MHIKTGDLVYISPSSKYYIGDKQNPINKIGVVKDRGRRTIYVDWGDCKNNYLQSDLVVVTLGKSVLSKLLVEPCPDTFVKSTKVCKGCGKQLMISSFSESNNSEDKLFPYCKCCVESFQSQHKQQYDRLYS
ncbi:hypothetical protein vBSdyM006_239 [Shigella phage vB_SdyM_006]|nr:hypothetical protein vBSdyM006_239 [Shigella phage vB_SdyM_006]